MAELGSVKGGTRTVRREATFRISDHTHFVRMGDQIIVADLRSGRYLGLDGVGARVWDLIGRRATRHDMVDLVHAEYEVSGDLLAQDVELLLQDLLKRRLIEYDLPS